MENSDIVQDGDDNRQNANQGIQGQMQSHPSTREFLISQSHKDKITKNYPDLVKNMVVNTVFLAHLRQEKVIDSSREEEIQVHPVSADKAAAVLRYIEKGPVYAFKALIKALIVTSQEHLADMLDKSLTDELKREMSEPKSHKSRPRQTHQGTGDHGKPSRVSPTDEIDLTQKDSIMKVEITPIDKDDARTRELMEKSMKGKGLYKMLSKTRGRAVIINITKFDDERRNREGAEFDTHNVKTLFSKMHFDVKLHTCNIHNITAEKLKNIIQQEAKDDFHKDTDCLVVFILSHGGEGYVLGSDGEKVSIKNDIALPFYATNCKHLEGKPKILFINSCRVKQGDQSDRELTADMQNLSLHGPSTMSDLKDFFRVYSTVEGFESPRNPKLGCIFVRMIVEVFQAYASTCSLLDLLLKVNKMVNDKKYPLLIDTQHTTDKEIYFFPGYDGSDSPESIQTHRDLEQQTESAKIIENDRNRFLLSESGSSQKETAYLLRNWLRDHYQHQLSIIHPVEWNLDVKMAIRDIYVEPQFQDITYQSQTEPSSGEHGAFVQQQSPLLNMQHLLDASKDGPSPRRILLQGPSGIGKTTVLQKIALDWAQRTHSPTDKFDQVLHFPIGTFSGNVPEAIRNMVLVDNQDTLSVNSLMSLFLDSEFQTKTLFLIDGYDDIPENDRTLLNDIWLGKKLRNCTVILTNDKGLPNHLSKATEKRCLLAGLSSENQDNYIGIYSCSHANQIFLSKPQFEGIFSQLSHNPLYLYFLCLIMKEHHRNLQITRVELLQTVVDLVIVRAAVKLKTPVESLRSELDKLYSVAFNCLVKGTLFVPPEVVLSHSELVALGILEQTKGPSELRPSTTYRFTHTIFQEYFTAKYLAQLPFAELKSKTAQLNLNQKMTIYVYLTGILANENNDSLLRDTFKLITQDLRAEGQYMIDEWSFGKDYTYRHNPGHLIPDCLCETGHVQDLGPVIAEVFPKCFAYSNKSCATCFRGILLAASYYQLNTTLYLVKQDINLELLHPGESCPNISSVVNVMPHWNMFSLLLHRFPAISQLFVFIVLPMIYPVSESYEKLSELLQSKRTVLKSLTICDVRLGDTRESDSLRILLQMAGKSLLQFHVRGFTLDHASAEEIVQAIARCNNLKGITFDEISCPEIEFDKIMSATKRCPYLVDVHFTSVHVTRREQHTSHGAKSDTRPPLPESAYSLLKKESLRSLVINQQSLSAKLLFFNSSIIQRLLLADIEWPMGIPNSLLKIIGNTKLEVLILYNQNISHSHPRGIEDIVCKVTNVDWLDISGNRIEKQPFSTICRHLANAPNLSRLFLSACNITDESILHLSLILEKNKLTVLYVDGNSISLHLITQLVTQGKSLEELAVTVKTCDLHHIEEMKDVLTSNHSSMDVLHLLLPCDGVVPLLPETVMRGVPYRVQVHLVTSVYDMLDKGSKYVEKQYEWEKILYN